MSTSKNKKLGNGHKIYVRMAKYKKKYGARRNYYRKRAAKRSLYNIGNLEENAPQRQARRILFGPSRRQRTAGMGTATRDQMIMRKGVNYYGDGNYFTDQLGKVDWRNAGRNLGHWGSRLGFAGGAALAASEAGPLGMIPAALGGWEAGAQYSKSKGWGNYSVPSVGNDLISGGTGNGNAPVYHSSTAVDEMGDVIISNRELVQLVDSSSTSKAFTVKKFDLNPIDDTFHHLRMQAKQYEQFEFVGLMFQYVPMSGEGGSNSLGVVGMAASYDPGSERTFNNMEDLMRFKGATTCKPSYGMTFGIECDPSKRPIKTMFTRDEVTRDKSFTDPATFYLATDGVSDTDTTIGQLWVTYSIKLKNIKPFSEEAPVNYLSSMHHPEPARDSATFVSSTDYLTMFRIANKSIIASTVNASQVATKINLDSKLKKDQFFDCIIASNRIGSSGTCQAIIPSCTGCELVKIPSHHDDTVSDYITATEDTKTITIFRVKVTASSGDRYITITRASASNPQMNIGFSISHSDSKEHIVSNAVDLLVR